MAGSEFGSAKTVEELIDIAAGIGIPDRRRTTSYGATALNGRSTSAALDRLPYIP